MFKDLIFELIGINRYADCLLYRSDNIIIMTNPDKFMFKNFGNIDSDIQLNDMKHSMLPSIRNIDEVIGTTNERRVFGNPENAKEYFKNDKDILIFVHHGYIISKSFFIMTTGDFTEEQKVLFELGLDFYD